MIKKVTSCHNFPLFVIVVFSIIFSVLLFRLSFSLRQRSTNSDKITPTPNINWVFRDEDSTASTGTLPERYLTPVPTSKPDLLIELTSNDLTPTKLNYSLPYPLWCQPNFFDPNESVYELQATGGNPKYHYVYSDENGHYSFMKNGWYKEDENKILLPNPYSVDYYEFGCASSFSYLLEIKKNDIRYALYPHVYQFAFSDNGLYLYFSNVTDQEVTHNRIVNIETKQSVELPKLDCVSGFGHWSQDKLITYSNVNVVSGGCPFSPTKVCVWNTQGELLNQLDVNMDWEAGAACYINSQFGILPNENTFYSTIYNFSDSDFYCSLALQDLNNKSNQKIFDLMSILSHCPKIDFDEEKLSINSTTLRFRDAEYELDENSEPGSREYIPGPWVEVTAQ